jgi:hypothetical protein
MKKILVRTYTMPTDYHPSNEVLYIAQNHFKSLGKVVNYTYNNKWSCEHGTTSAIFTVRPKKEAQP